MEGSVYRFWCVKVFRFRVLGTIKMDFRGRVEFVDPLKSPLLDCSSPQSTYSNAIVIKQDCIVGMTT